MNFQFIIGTLLVISALIFLVSNNKEKFQPEKNLRRDPNNDGHKGPQTTKPNKHSRKDHQALHNSDTANYKVLQKAITKLEDTIKKTANDAATATTSAAAAVETKILSLIDERIKKYLVTATKDIFVKIGENLTQYKEELKGKMISFIERENETPHLRPVLKNVFSNVNLYIRLFLNLLLDEDTDPFETREIHVGKSQNSSITFELNKNKNNIDYTNFTFPVIVNKDNWYDTKNISDDDINAEFSIYYNHEDKLEIKRIDKDSGWNFELIFNCIKSIGNLLEQVKVNYANDLKKIHNIYGPSIESTYKDIISSFLNKKNKKNNNVPSDLDRDLLVNDEKLHARVYGSGFSCIKDGIYKRITKYKGKSYSSYVMIIDKDGNPVVTDNDANQVDPAGNRKIYIADRSYQISCDKDTFYDYQLPGAGQEINIMVDFASDVNNFQAMNDGIAGFENFKIYATPY